MSESESERSLVFLARALLLLLLLLALVVLKVVVLNRGGITGVTATGSAGAAGIGARAGGGGRISQPSRVFTGFLSLDFLGGAMEVSS